MSSVRAKLRAILFFVVLSAVVGGPVACAEEPDQDRHDASVHRAIVPNREAVPNIDLMAARQRKEQRALTHEGSWRRGGGLFRDEKRTKCVTCHRVHGKGALTGPDLSNIGSKFNRPHLIESVLEPSHQIVEGYRTSTILTIDGITKTGFIFERSKEDITLVDIEGKSHKILAEDIEQQIASPLSMMPDGLVDTLTDDEFADLIAYLESLRPEGMPVHGAGVKNPVALPEGFVVETIASQLTGCTALETTVDGRVFLCEQTGAVRIVKNGKLLDEPFVTLQVDKTWERGVIGVTVHPDFPKQPFVYVCYISGDPYPHHRISRFRAEGDVAVPGSEKILLTGDDQRTMGGDVPNGHQGGGLHFGADGKLYLGIGEQTSGMPSQDINSFLGKILRINPDGTIPSDNPFFHQATGKYRAVWARGCRNPYTFAIHPRTGQMLINDVGGKFEEINRGIAGANYGWPVVNHGPTKDERFVGPIHWYPEASICGADFAPDEGKWPNKYKGRFFFADYVHGWIKTLDPKNPQDVTTFSTRMRRPVDLRFAPDGSSLYVLLRDAWVIDEKFHGSTGTLLRIRYADRHDSVGDCAAPAPVVLVEDARDESAGGLPAFRVETPTATYYLEKSGGGLSSMIDNEGNDWINFHPQPGSGAGGEYRGFPNAVHEQPNSFFHPRNQATDLCKTTVRYVGHNRVTLEAESSDGDWACRYDFFATHCTFTMTRMPNKGKYWGLYEGTPGGQLDHDDWWMTSAIATPQPITQTHDHDIPSPEWIAFGDKRLDRSLLIAHHQDDTHPDQFYQMNNKMTVFGFARQGLKKFFDTVPQQISIGLIENTEHSTIADHASQWLSMAAVSDSSSHERPSIDLWYGHDQSFGRNGVPQKWINLLGRVSPVESVRLEYRLNDSEMRPLSVGPDFARLAAPGDFNVEIDTAELLPGKNEIRLVATDSHGQTGEEIVVVEWMPVDRVQLPISIDWSQADAINDVAQVVDGRWVLTEEGVRSIEPYYDRVIAFGDRSWSDYQVETTVTFHGRRIPGSRDIGGSVVHAAVATRWPGHDLDDRQPHVKWFPLGATSEFTLTEWPEGCRWRILGSQLHKDYFFEKRRRTIQLEKTYHVKHRVRTLPDESTEYRVKLWPISLSEPAEWDLVVVENPDQVSHGGALIIAHYTDVTFGNILVTDAKN